MRTLVRGWGLGVGVAVLVGSLGCTKKGEGPPASKAAPRETAIPKVPSPPADGPPLVALAPVVKVFQGPSTATAVIGYLHGGGRVARAAKPYSKKGCSGGWYPVRPRGFVCANEKVGLTSYEPKASFFGAAPNLESSTPYTYARAKGKTSLYGVTPDGRALTKAGDLAPLHGLAVSGSWKAPLKAGSKAKTLATLPSGEFVRAKHLREAAISEFQGRELSGKKPLPMGFIVRTKGATPVKFGKKKLQRLPLLKKHEAVLLTGKYRTKGKHRFWGMRNGAHLDQANFTLVRKRSKFPEYAVGKAKWIDISIIMGTMVLYEGKTPVYATLISAGEDRLDGDHITKVGEFMVIGKEITAESDKEDAHDPRIKVRSAPWVLRLSSGQAILGAYWHNRFGVVHGKGSVQLSPRDAAYVWSWADGQLPEGWHGAALTGDLKTRVSIHK